MLASWIDAHLYLPRLRSSLRKMRQLPGLSDSHKPNIFRWILINNRTSFTFSSESLYDLILASILNECLVARMESAKASLSHEHLDQVVVSIYEYVRLPRKSSLEASMPTTNGTAVNRASTERQEISSSAPDM